MVIHTKAYRIKCQEVQLNAEHKLYKRGGASAKALCSVHGGLWSNTSFSS